MRVLISGCLLGMACRYDGKTKPLPKEIIDRLKNRFELIPICPEQMGGLPTPRYPSERQGELFINSKGENVTEQYLKGAEEALKLARELNCKIALLKEKSPSCGNEKIYDGSFSKRLIDGKGSTAELLSENAIKIFGETQVEALLNLDFSEIKVKSEHY